MTQNQQSQQQKSFSDLAVMQKKNNVQNLMNQPHTE
jgi:hypothetical protein